MLQGCLLEVAGRMIVEATGIYCTSDQVPVSTFLFIRNVYLIVLNQVWLVRVTSASVWDDVVIEGQNSFY
jgi:hypothetical protein